MCSHIFTQFSPWGFALFSPKILAWPKLVIPNLVLVDGELVSTDMSHGLLTDYENGLGNVWFSTCNSSVDFEESTSFEICQAGYKDRKLVYDIRQR